MTASAAKLFHLPATHGLLVATRPARQRAPPRRACAPARRNATLAGETYPLGGDLITKVDSTPLYSLDQLRDVIDDKQPGDEVRLETYRGDQQRTVTVKLGRQPSSPS